MRRVAAQILYCSPDEIIENGMVELSEEGLVCSVRSLQTCQSEPPQTIFLNGIILPFRPNTQEIGTDGILDVLRRQYNSQGCAPIAVGATAALWFLSSDNLFHGKPTSTHAVRIA